MNLRWMRATLIVVQASLVGVWVLNAAHRLRRPHADWSTILDPSLLITLMVISTLAWPGLAAMPGGRVNGRRVVLVTGIALAVALVAVAAGYYAARAAG